MRLFTTLSLGAAALMCAAVPLSAQDLAAVERNATAAASTSATETAPVETPESRAAADQLANDSDGIAAIVNDESISDYEVRQRMALFIATSGLQPTAEDRKRIRAQILDQLENEKIELQEAVKKKVTVSPIEVDKQIDRLLSENHFSVEQMGTVLASAGSSIDALRAQITAQIAWQKAVQSEYQDDVNIKPSQVDDAMRREAEGANKPHYLVSEIFIPVNAPEEDAKARKSVDDVAAQLHNGASFPNMAHQLSQNPSAAAGGDIGWVREGQLAPELNAVLTKMTIGQISDPVRSLGGYYILALRERQEPLGTKVQIVAPEATAHPESLPLARLLLPMAGANKEQVEAAMKAATQVRAAITSCEQLSKIHDGMKGTVYMNLGEMKVSELSPDIQKALAQTKSGDVAIPFLSDAGIEIIARCDKRAPPQAVAFTMPTREQIEEQLFQAQISALARRYIRDLKRDANIQVRDADGRIRDAALIR